MSGAAGAAPDASARSGALRGTPTPSSPGTDGTRLAADPSSTSPEATTAPATLPDVARTPPPPHDAPAASTSRGSPLTPDERAGLDLIETLAERATEEMAVLRRELASERARVAAYAAELARIRAATEARLTRGFESVSDAVDRVKSSAEASDATRREAAAERERARAQRVELERRVSDAERREAETREALHRERLRNSQLVAALNAVRDGADREMRERDATCRRRRQPAAARRRRARRRRGIARRGGDGDREGGDAKRRGYGDAKRPRAYPGGGRRVAPSASAASPVASPTRSSPAGGPRARRCAAREARRAGPGGDLAAITRWCATCDEDGTGAESAGARAGRSFGTGIVADEGIVAGTGSAAPPPPPPRGILAALAASTRVARGHRPSRRERRPSRRGGGTSRRGGGASREGSRGVGA